MIASDFIIIQTMNSNQFQWTKKEMKIMASMLNSQEQHDWNQIRDSMNLKFSHHLFTSKQCRQNWRKTIKSKQKKWEIKQDKALFKAYFQYGNQWKAIAALFPSCTDNNVKNHFYSLLRKRLRIICKKLGVKNSTSIIKSIKPSVISDLILDIQNSQSDKIGNQNRKSDKLTLFVNFLVNFDDTSFELALKKEQNANFFKSMINDLRMKSREKKENSIQDTKKYRSRSLRNQDEYEKQQTMQEFKLQDNFNQEKSCQNQSCFKQNFSDFFMDQSSFKYYSPEVFCNLNDQKGCQLMEENSFNFPLTQTFYD